MKTVIAKVQVSAIFRQWWESDLSDIFTNPDEVTIVSAVVEDGGIYLIYTYKTNEEI